jgi:hypothetical protein
MTIKKNGFNPQSLFMGIIINILVGKSKENVPNCRLKMRAQNELPRGKLRGIKPGGFRNLHLTFIIICVICEICGLKMHSRETK